jgi:hypothetical protein
LKSSVDARIVTELTTFVNANPKDGEDEDGAAHEVLHRWGHRLMPLLKLRGGVLQE